MPVAASQPLALLRSVYVSELHAGNVSGSIRIMAPAVLLQPALRRAQRSITLPLRVAAAAGAAGAASSLPPPAAPHFTRWSPSASRELAQPVKLTFDPSLQIVKLSAEATGGIRLLCYFCASLPAETSAAAVFDLAPIEQQHSRRISGSFSFPLIPLWYDTHGRLKLVVTTPALDLYVHSSSRGVPPQRVELQDPLYTMYAWTTACEDMRVRAHVALSGELAAAWPSQRFLELAAAALRRGLEGATSGTDSHVAIASVSDEYRDATSATEQPSSSPIAHALAAAWPRRPAAGTVTGSGPGTELVPPSPSQAAAVTIPAADIHWGTMLQRAGPAAEQKDSISANFSGGSTGHLAPLLRHADASADADTEGEGGGGAASRLHRRGASSSSAAAADAARSYDAYAPVSDTPYLTRIFNVFGRGGWRRRSQDSSQHEQQQPLSHRQETAQKLLALIRRADATSASITVIDDQPPPWTRAIADDAAASYGGGGGGGLQAVSGLFATVTRGVGGKNGRDERVRLLPPGAAGAVDDSAIELVPTGHARTQAADALWLRIDVAPRPHTATWITVALSIGLILLTALLLAAGIWLNTLFRS